MNAVSIFMAAVLGASVVSVEASAAEYGKRVPPTGTETFTETQVSEPTGPVYRFRSYGSDRAAPPDLWGYQFGSGTAVSPAYNNYAPGYRSGPAFSAPPVGSYYASPCYFEPQQVWDGHRWFVTRARICR